MYKIKKGRTINIHPYEKKYKNKGNIKKQMNLKKTMQKDRMQKETYQNLPGMADVKEGIEEN